MSSKPEANWPAESRSSKLLAADFSRLFELCGMGDLSFCDQQLNLSAQAARLLGFPDEARVLWLDEFIDSIDPDDRRPAASALTVGSVGNDPVDFRFRILSRGSRPPWRRLQAVASATSNGLTGVLTDIDELVGFERQYAQLQEAIRRADKKLDLAMMANRDAVWDWDIRTNELFFSPHFANALGLAADIPMPSLGQFREKLHPDDAPLLDEHLRAEVERGANISIEFRIRDSEGAYRWFHCTGSIRFDEQGRAAGVGGALRDIHDYRVATEQLQIALFEQQHMSRMVQEMSARVVQAQEEDRRHIARELHDEIGQSLTATIMELEFWRDRPMQEEARQSAVTEVRRALAQVRDLSLNLRPSLLDSAGLEAAMRWYLERQAKAGQFHLTLSVEGVAERPSPVVEITAFRITQEAITNITRHSHARHVEVSVKTTEKDLALRISDDGDGFEVGNALGKATQGNSMGLLGMQERAHLIGGHCDIKSMPGMGSVIIVRLPLKIVP